MLVDLKEENITVGRLGFSICIQIENGESTHYYLIDDKKLAIKIEKQLQEARISVERLKLSI